MAVSSILVTDAAGANVTINTLPDRGVSNSAGALPITHASDDNLYILASQTGVITRTKAQSSYDCTITTGQSLSSSVDLTTGRLRSIIFPAGFTANSITFQASYDNVTFSNVYDEQGIEKEIFSVANSYVVVTPTTFSGIRYLKVRTGTSASPNVVASNTTMKLIAEG